MDAPDNINCEQCESPSPVVMVRGAGQVLWPKSTVRGVHLFVFINCPECGEREQCVAPTAEAD